MALLIEEAPGETSAEMSCKLCMKRVEPNEMRRHVGSHILRENLVGRCGFCGLERCTTSLKATSHSGGKTYYKHESNCAYFVQIRNQVKPLKKRHCMKSFIVRSVKFRSGNTICKNIIWINTKVTNIALFIIFCPQ